LDIQGGKSSVAAERSREDEAAELESLLRDDAEARRVFRSYMELDAALGRVAASTACRVDISASEAAPGEWSVATFDLWKDMGSFTLTGITPNRFMPCRSRYVSMGCQRNS
jgi:hypothetical protein